MSWLSLNSHRPGLSGIKLCSWNTVNTIKNVCVYTHTHTHTHTCTIYIDHTYIIFFKKMLSFLLIFNTVHLHKDIVNGLARTKQERSGPDYWTHCWSLWRWILCWRWMKTEVHPNLISTPPHLSTRETHDSTISPAGDHFSQPIVVAPVCNPSTWGAEAGGFLLLWSHSLGHTKF